MSVSRHRSRQKKDWHPEDIKAAVRKTGTNLGQLALQNGLSESACRKSLRVPAPRSDRAISDLLNVPLNELWPSRYDAQGRRVIIHVREKNISNRASAQRISEAAV